MRVVVCPDKFKGSLSALEACRAIRSGIERRWPRSDVSLHPMSDGGDGMLEVLARNLELEPVSVAVADPLFRPVTAAYGVSPDGATAYLEMARASGLALLEAAERDCLETTTLGTGQMIRDALDRGARRIVLGIGGSATNDAGIGMAAALGYRFRDPAGAELRPVGRNLVRLDTIDDRGVAPELAAVGVVVAADVRNPLHGEHGAAWVFARQKGADDDAIRLLDQGLVNFARVVGQKWGLDLERIPGAGAAGALGGGAIAFLGASLRSGVELMIELTGLEAHIAQADLVITGEGRLDEQTLTGKVVAGVAGVAGRHRKNLAAICGSSSLPAARLRSLGIHHLEAILNEGRSLDDAMAHAFGYVEEAAAALADRIGDGSAHPN